MAIFTLYPNADVKDEWAEFPVGGAWERLANESRTDWVQTSTVDAVTRVEYETVTIPAGDTVAMVEVEADVLAFGGEIEMAILIDSTVTIRKVTALNTTDGIVRVDVSAPLTQAQLDGIRFHCVCKVGGTAFVYAAPMRVYTRSDTWASVNAKLRVGRDPSTGLSTGSGAFMGSDFGPSVDLGGGRSFGTGGDAGIATASGQQFWFGENQANPAADRATFVRNVGYLWDAYDLEAANLTVYENAGGGAFHPDDATYGGRWPFKYFVRSGRLFTVGRFSVFPHDLIWVGYTDSFSGAPDTWTWTYLPPFRAFCADRPNGEYGIWDDGANYVYMWSCGPNIGHTRWNVVSLCRLRLSKFQNFDWARPEWFTGRSWITDQQLALSRSVAAGIRTRRRPRGNLLESLEVPMNNQGSVHRRASDNRFQLTFMDDFSTVGGLGPMSLRYALTPGTTPDKFGPPVGKYIVPIGQAFVYGMSAEPQYTWPGKGANDQVWHYASNWGDTGRTWEPSYYVRYVKALSVT